MTPPNASDDSVATPTYSELSPEQRAAMDAWLAAHPYGEQDENGIDLSVLRRNLRLTPTERLLRLQSGANSLRGLKQSRNAR